MLAFSAQERLFLSPVRKSTFSVHFQVKWLTGSHGCLSASALISNNVHMNPGGRANSRPDALTHTEVPEVGAQTIFHLFLFKQHSNIVQSELSLKGTEVKGKTTVTFYWPPCCFLNWRPERRSLNVVFYVPIDLILWSFCWIIRHQNLCFLNPLYMRNGCLTARLFYSPNLQFVETSLFHLYGLSPAQGCWACRPFLNLLHQATRSSSIVSTDFIL